MLRTLPAQGLPRQAGGPWEAAQGRAGRHAGAGQVRCSSLLVLVLASIGHTQAHKAQYAFCPNTHRSAPH